MKIEKISERQIRCTLNKKDLVDRELRLSELAYGTDKAKELFRDMMQQASYELGFEADDIPLMIEAIPVSNECLVLVVTKVDYTDELDTRFSKFTDDAAVDDYCDENEEDDEDCFDDEVINCFGKIDDLLDDTNNGEDSFVPLPKAIGVDNYSITDTDKERHTKNESENKIKRVYSVYSFDSLENVIKACSIIVPYFKGDSCLYKNTTTSTYYLAIIKFDNKQEDLNRVCGIISEYGKLERTTYASLYYYSEHFKSIIEEDAVNILSTM